MCDSLLVAVISIVHRDPIHPGFMCLKGLCRGVPQNSVYDAKCHGSFQFIKIQLFFDNVYKHFDFPIVGDNICGSKTAINDPAKGRSMRGRGRSVY